MAVFKWMDAAVLIPTSLIATFLNVRFSLSTRFIEGLKQFVPTAASSATGTPSEKKKASNTKASVGLGDAENLIVYPIPRSQVESSLHAQILDRLIFITELLILSSVVYPLVSYLHITPPLLPTPILFALGVAIVALVDLSRIEIFAARGCGPEEKGRALLSGLAGFVAAATLFALEPPRTAFAWDPEAGNQAMSSVIRHVALKAAPEGMPIEDAVRALTPPPVFLRTLLCAIASCISSQLLGPSVRFVRAFRLQQEHPEWAGGLVVPSTVGTMKMNLVLLLPGISALSWIDPLFKIPLGLAEYHAVAVRSCLAVVTGLLFLLTTRLVVQRYLDSALVAWHTYKHGARRTPSERAAAAQIIQTNALIVGQLVVKSAIQIIAPGVFFLACGLVFATLIGHPVLQSSEPAQDVLALLSCVVGFSLWWAGLMWIVFCSGALWLFRTGTLTT